jgi:putative transposase
MSISICGSETRRQIRRAQRAGGRDLQRREQNSRLPVRMDEAKATHGACLRFGKGCQADHVRRGLQVIYSKAKRHYSSYGGQISEAPENLVKRNFHAEKPNELWLTDITEFATPCGKVYLSPVLDCFEEKLVSWEIGISPNAELANGSLEDACASLRDGEYPVSHSDRGCHYRWPGWIRICKDNGITRSMSKKGCSPDNSACEGFFGRLKNEFFYFQDLSGVSMEEFICRLDAYLRYYNERRIKQSLGWLSPNQYRRSLGGGCNLNWTPS